MFKRNKDDAPGMAGEQVFRHVMNTLYGLGEPGAMITPGIIMAARDLAKRERLDALNEDGEPSSKDRRQTEAAYDRVGGKVLAMFAGPYAGSTFASDEDDAQLGSDAGISPKGPCPNSLLGPNLGQHISMQIGDGEITCYYCNAVLTSAT